MTTILVNGEAKQTISAYDRGLHYGDGVFETMFVQSGRIRLWDEHWIRLLEGCQRLNINAPNRIQIEKEIESLCQKESRAVIKLIVTRGDGPRGYRVPTEEHVTHIVYRYPWSDYPAEYSIEGINVRTCTMRLSENPLLAGIKHLNRLEQVMARNEWTSDEFQEGLMLSSQGYVVDGIMSNLFVVKSGCLLTPDLSLCGVMGVMRHSIIKIAQSLGITVQVKSILPGELELMDEIFLTNSLFGIWPVKKIDALNFPVGKITRRLQDEINSCLGMK